MGKRIIAAQDLYLNGDKTAAVQEGSASAAFLLIRKGKEVPDEFEDLITASGKPRKPKTSPKPKGRGKAKATKEIKPGEDK